MSCHLGHAHDELFPWCPYCPQGPERRRRFFDLALAAVRRRWRP